MVFGLFGLDDLWNAIKSVPYWILDLLVMVLNGIIAAIGWILALILMGLPPFPAAPEPPSGVWGFLMWLFPIGAVVTGAFAILSCWIAFMGVKILLKWGKAL